MRGFFRRTGAVVFGITEIIACLNRSFGKGFCAFRQFSRLFRNVEEHPMPPTTTRRSIGVEDGDRITFSAFWSVGPVESRFLPLQPKIFPTCFAGRAVSSSNDGLTRLKTGSDACETEPTSNAKMRKCFSLFIASENGSIVLRSHRNRVHTHCHRP